MSENQIKCLTLKINEDEILLPNAAVAEIVPIKNIINVANSRAGCWVISTGVAIRCL